MASSRFTIGASWSALPKLQGCESRFVPVSDFSKNFPVVKCSLTTQTWGIFQESLTTMIIIIILFFFLKERTESADEVSVPWKAGRFLEKQSNGYGREQGRRPLLPYKPLGLKAPHLL